MTETAGFFDCEVERFSRWLSDVLTDDQPPPQVFGITRPGWTSLVEAVADLAPTMDGNMRACVPVGGWTALLTNGPQGTDVGVLPMHAAVDLGCRALRVTCVPDGTDALPARVLELFGPEAPAEDLHCVRAIAAAKDGERWVFETAGQPLPFEDLARYGERRKSRRFPPDLLLAYLTALGVPWSGEPDWSRALVVQPL